MFIILQKKQLSLMLTFANGLLLCLERLTHFLYHHNHHNSESVLNDNMTHLRYSEVKIGAADSLPFSPTV